MWKTLTNKFLFASLQFVLSPAWMWFLIIATRLMTQEGSSLPWFSYTHHSHLTGFHNFKAKFFTWRSPFWHVQRAAANAVMQQQCRESFLFHSFGLRALLWNQTRGLSWSCWNASFPTKVHFFSNWKGIFVRWALLRPSKPSFYSNKRDLKTSLHVSSISLKHIRY